MKNTRITGNAAGLLLLVIFSCTSALDGQAPSAFNYQAVIRDAGGNLRANETLEIQLVLHRGTATGISVYEETHNTATSELGLVNLQVGSGIRPLFRRSTGRPVLTSLKSG
jgi:trimeric autotransporter adhesin